MRRGAARFGPILGLVAAVVAPVACLLPWETVTVPAAGPSGVTHLSVLHGAGLLAALGAGVALLALAARLGLPDRRGLGDGLTALAGSLLVLGAALFPFSGGERPGSGPGWSVSVAAGLPLAAVAGVLLLTALLLGRATV